ncbi:hypothetical protein [Fructobacillus parabroussonetiae]|uniref:Uncharacterized protein n=1 Tax=Fructobacillus parabroussonetiae TaxID=2713174 RepID=A0ABS5QXT4_9LACO|nr:hypothetical protein [Fructobacillus parabroussonetiae]MBS9338004.1 hypothetical protein [Fructobacillus parabroussonetiae]
MITLIGFVAIFWILIWFTWKLWTSWIPLLILLLIGMYIVTFLFSFWGLILMGVIAALAIAGYFSPEQRAKRAADKKEFDDMMKFYEDDND